MKTALVRFESECLIYLKSIRDNNVRSLENDSLPFVLTILRTHHGTSLFSTQIQLISLDILKVFASRDILLLINEHALVDIQSLLMTSISSVQKSALLTLLVVVKKQESLLYISKDVCVRLLNLTANSSMSDLVYQLLGELCLLSDQLLETTVNHIKFSWVTSQLCDYDRHGSICKFLEIITKLCYDACQAMVNRGLHATLWDLISDDRYQYPIVSMQIMINICRRDLNLANNVLNVNSVIPVLNSFLSSKYPKQNELGLLLCHVCGQYGKRKSNFYLVNIEHHMNKPNESEDSAVIVENTQ